MSFTKDYELKKIEADNIINELSSIVETMPEPLQASVKYSLFNGGKRVRPVLFLETYRIFGGTELTESVKKFMQAIECIHVYSLIHDDLPAMDNDDLRRGKPTNHIVFGDGIAILAGDALLNLAFELVLDAVVLSGYQKNYSEAALILSRLCGGNGLIAGQTLDIYSKHDVMTAEKLDFIYKHKTGDLMKSAVVCGAMLAGATEENINCLMIYADNFGYAFQIKDDILDFEENIDHDIKNYVDLHGISNAKAALNDKIDTSVSALLNIDKDTTFLKKFAQKSISRKE